MMAEEGELKLFKGDGPTPPLELKDLAGKNVRIKDFHGQVVVLNFWATWCPPCREEMPSMWRLKQKLKDKPFAVVAVDLDETEKEVKAFLTKEMQRDFIVLIAKKDVALEKWEVALVSG